MAKSNKNNKKNRKLIRLQRRILSIINDAKDFSVAKFGAKWVIVAGSWGFVFFALIILYYSYDLPSTSKLMESTKAPNIKILNESGELVANYGQYYGSYMEYDNFPPHLIQAVLATEDRRFFEHFGVDVYGLARAMIVNLKAGHVVQGGSTITQQLAKIAFLTPERTIKRKFQEMLLALWLERKFTKKEIITIYLNRVYLGGGNYGVDSAARSYFGKSARNLTLSESAVIAGLLRAPSRYSPLTNPVLSAKRASQVLANMADAGYIPLEKAVAAEKQLSSKEDIKLSHGNLYFADWIVEQLPDYIGNVTSDITVIITLNLRMQKIAEEVVERHVRENAEFNVTQGSLLALSSDGRILAMVGGKSYKTSQFNRVTQALRQPGSAFKLFVYLAAFENGFSADSEMEDKPIALKDAVGTNWAPENYGEEFHGTMTLSEAFARSINSIAVQLGQEIGTDAIVALAQKMGVTSKLMSVPSAVLGTNEMTLLELTQAYNVMPNDGRFIKAYAIKQVMDADGNTLYERQSTEPEQAVDINIARRMNGMLMDVINYGTGRFGKLDRPAGGKTGTTQDYRDAWFIGFTPQITAGVWVGNDNNSTMKEITGGKVPVMIWKDFMTAAHQNLGIMDIPTGSISLMNPLQYMNYYRNRQGSGYINEPPVNKGPSVFDRLFNSKEEKTQQEQNNSSNPKPRGKVEYTYPGSRIPRN